MSKPKLPGLIGLGFLLACGLVMNILACTLKFKDDDEGSRSSAWPIISVVCYFLAPIPNLLVKKDDDPFSENSSGLRHVAMFVTGALIVSGFGVPLVLAHAETIDERSMALALAGGLVVYGTMIAYLHFFLKKDEDEINM